MTRRVILRLQVGLAGLLLAALAFTGVASAAAPGSLDGSFGGGIVSLGSGVQVLGVAVGSDGSVFVAGQSGGRVLVEHLGSTGQPVGSYLGPSGYARAVAVAPGGKIVVAETTGGMLVQRLTSALAPDGSFGSGGSASAFPGGVANGVAVAADGSVAVAGTVGGSAAVARFSAGGGLEWSSAPTGTTFNSVAIQPDGKVVAVGYQFSNPFTNALAVRFAPTGGLDGSFGSGGISTYQDNFPSTGYTSLNGVALQNNGQIVIAGVAEGGADQRPQAAVERLNPDGSHDHGFGSNGIAEQDSGMNVTALEYPIGAYAVGVAGGGRIVAAGNFENTGTAVDQALWAFTPSGGIESSFGSGGVALAPTGTYEACGLAVDPNSGNLVTVGDAVQSFPDANPCQVGRGGGIVSRFIGFGPPPAPGSQGAAPVASTGSAVSIGQSSARVTGTVNPGQLATSYHFEYGKTSAYGSSSATGSAGAGGLAVGVTATLGGLSPATTYHYRLVASNADGTSHGADQTFTTQRRLHVTLSRTPRSVARSILAKHGLLLTLSCNQACKASGSLVLSSASAKHLHLGKHQITIASGSVRLRHGGKGKLVLHVAKSAAKLLGHLRGVSVSLQITVKSSAGGGTSRTSRKLTLT